MLGQMPPLNSSSDPMIHPPADEFGIELSYEDPVSSPSSLDCIDHDLFTSPLSINADTEDFGVVVESREASEDEEPADKLELNPIKLRMQISDLQTVASVAQERANEAESKVVSLQTQLDNAEKNHKIKTQEYTSNFENEKTEIYNSFNAKIQAMERVDYDIKRSWSHRMSSHELSGSIEGSTDDIANKYFVKSLKDSLRRAEEEAADKQKKVLELEKVIVGLQESLQAERQLRIEESGLASKKLDDFKEESANKFSQVKKLCEAELRSIQEANRDSLVKKEEAIQKIRTDMKEKLMSMHETSMEKIKKLEDLHKTEVTERDDLITKYKKNRQYLISLRVHEEKAAAARLGDLKFDMMMKINDAQKAAADALQATEEKLTAIQEVHKNKIMQKDQELEGAQMEIRTLKTWADEEKISLHKLDALREEMETRLRNAKTCADEELRLTEDKWRKIIDKNVETIHRKDDIIQHYEHERKSVRRLTQIGFDVTKKSLKKSLTFTRRKIQTNLQDVTF